MKMHIVVEPGSYLCLNMGDVAMMQVAVKRLGELWPHAQIEVVTGRPDRLLSLCSSAVPLSTEERKAWLSGRSLMGGSTRGYCPLFRPFCKDQRGLSGFVSHQSQTPESALSR